MPVTRLPLPARLPPRPRAQAAAALTASLLGMALAGCQTLRRLGDFVVPQEGAGAKVPASVQGPPREPLAPSPRLVVGRVVAIDQDLRHAIVELGAEAPREALVPDAELTTRDASLRETGKLRVSRQLRGRILGTFLLAGSPAVDNEVVWLAP